MTETPLFLLNVFKAASIKLDYFVNTSFAENIQWLREIEEEARKAFGSASITLLPKTPSMKRKRPDIVKANGNITKSNETTSEHASTFVDGVMTKKLRIDDMSAIVENAEDTTVTMMEKCETSILRKTRQIRKKKMSSQPVKRSKRLAAKSDVSYVESPMMYSANRKQNKDEIIINDTLDVPSSSSPSVVCSSPTQITSLIANSVIVSPVPHVQPKVAALIEKLRLTAQKSTMTNSPYSSPNSEQMDEIRMTLFPNDEQSSPGKESSVKDSNQAASVRVNTKESTPIKQMRHVSPSIPDNTNDTEILPSDHNMDECVNQDQVGFTKIVTKIDSVDAISSSQQQTSSESPSESDSDHLSAIGKVPGRNSVVDNSGGRRDTYKVVVMEKELPKKSTPKQIPLNVETCWVDIGSPGLSEDPVQDFVPTEPRKGPKIFKPIKASNIATGIKSFLKKGDTPKKETEEERQRKKAAELERKENNRIKAMEETHLKRQKLLEERKKLRGQREKEFAERQVRRQKEEEEKRLQLENKAKQVFKNREMIKKKKEFEEKKKREMRDMKTAEANARRQREEEECKRRVLEQIEEENKRQEMLQRKAEYEEQERLKKKMENDRADKDRLRLIEEDRLLNDQRKKREYEEKERHRLEVERKLKEEREKERLEKQKREERLKQADKEIEDAKKHEMERERAKLRDDIKAQINQEKHLKGSQFNPKVVINAQAGNRSSPRFAGKENFKSPSATAVSMKSPAAYNSNKPAATYNPPRVPLMIRDSSYCCYPIDDLGSDDSTDDEAEPAKRVPSWAQGINLKTQLMQQFYTNIDPDLIFINCMEPCRLDKIFQKKKERYFKRTSSAHWTSPIMKSKILP